MPNLSLLELFGVCAPCSGDGGQELRKGHHVDVAPVREADDQPDNHEQDAVDVDGDLTTRVETFYEHLSAQTGGGGGHSFSLAVRRGKAFQDSYRQLKDQNLKRARISVSYVGEGGIDHGGLRREWFAHVSLQMVSEEVGLFRAVGDQTTFDPSPASGVRNCEHLAQFEFCGRFVGMAIEQKRFLYYCPFSRVVYKHLLGLPVAFEDLESIDPATYKSFLKMLPKGDQQSEIDPADLCFTFTATVMDSHGKNVDKELIVGGSDIDVNRDNVEEYVNLYPQVVLVDPIREQLAAFASGFFEIIPREYISLFTPIELEYLIRGV